MGWVGQGECLAGVGLTLMSTLLFLCGFSAIFAVVALWSVKVVFGGGGWVVLSAQRMLLCSFSFTPHTLRRSHLILTLALDSDQELGILCNSRRPAMTFVEAKPRAARVPGKVGGFWRVDANLESGSW